MLVDRAGRSEPVVLDFFVEAPGRGADERARARAGPGQRLVRRRGPDVQHRPRVGRQPTACRPASATRRAVRPHAARRAGRAGGRAARARVSSSYLSRPTWSRSSPGSSPRRRSAPRCSRPMGALLAGRRRDAPAGARRRARAARSGGRRAVLHGRHRGGDRRLARGARRHADDARTWRPTRSSSASRSRSPTAGREVRHQPAAVGRRDPDRARARAARLPAPRAPGAARSVARWRRRRRRARPSSWRGSDDPEFLRARFLAAAPRTAARARPPTSRSSTATAGRARSPAATARARA